MESLFRYVGHFFTSTDRRLSGSYASARKEISELANPGSAMPSGKIDPDEASSVWTKRYGAFIEGNVDGAEYRRRPTK